MELHPPIYLADLVCIYLNICSKFQLHYSCFGVLKTKHPIASGGAAPQTPALKIHLHNLTPLQEILDPPLAHVMFLEWMDVCFNSLHQEFQSNYVKLYNYTLRQIYI